MEQSNFFFKNKNVIIYLAKFIGAFCLCYFGTLAIIGLSAPVGYYNNFVDNYLNFIPAFRNSLLHAAKFVLSVFGYNAYQTSPTHLQLGNSGGVNLGYDCLGYGVTSFWLAFMFANKGSFKKKLLWMLGGTAALYIVNIIRISLVAASTVKLWRFPFGWDNHTWFNIAAYVVIFFMIWVYDKTAKKAERAEKLTS